MYHHTNLITSLKWIKIEKNIIIVEDGFFILMTSILVTLANWQFHLMHYINTTYFTKADDFTTLNAWEQMEGFFLL